ncbi:hypothetical protein FNF29_04923 [Cafeteria roenbergensis]|uniref:Maf-like protein n=1 Tax=Cafeteria roenbergensis TaxID=33653 RepID=A0A5A8CEN9_CAFRO|nr:hypothetical protein FNF29_04923 [Cafeteria roenbergensis]|eukprot:KAA0151034.1 hypothetical protein FNF29_04923 [Cafeteria roenbergensis]
MAALIADVLPRLRELDIVLASTSPRRAEILRAMGLPFTQRAPPFEEALEHRRFASPAHYVAANAWGKALSILAEPAEPAEHGEKTGRGTVIVASDTSSRVEFVNFSDAAAEAYAAGGEPLDKAGGYAVQGAGGSLVRSLEGDFHAVMGLPMALTAAMLRPAAAQAGGRGCGGE